MIVHAFPEDVRLSTLCGEKPVPPGEAATGYASEWTCPRCLQAAGLRTCPACAADAVLVRLLDRFFHEDGSDNRPCWRQVSRGVAVAPHLRAPGHGKTVDGGAS